MIWSPMAEEVVSGLIAELPDDMMPSLRDEGKRLRALPIGWSMWAAYFLRPSGEVVVVGEDADLPDADTVYTEHVQVLMVMVWGSSRYPELKALLPIRGPRATDCRCREIPVFAEGKILCSECGGLGWLPCTDAYWPRLDTTAISSKR